MGQTLTIWDDGTVNLNGGTINTGSLVFAGSTLNFNAGKLHLAGDPGLDGTFKSNVLDYFRFQALRQECRRA